MSEDRIDALEQQVEELTEMVREIKRDQHQLEENLRSGLGHAEAHAVEQAKQEIAKEYGLDGEELVEQAFIRGFNRSREGLNGEVFQPNLDEYDGDFEDKLRQYFADDIAETKQDLLDQIDGESSG